jgi:hypothetical protein
MIIIRSRMELLAWNDPPIEDLMTGEIRAVESCYTRDESNCGGGHNRQSDTLRLSKVDTKEGVTGCCL